jgi:hypothetical protein
MLLNLNPRTGLSEMLASLIDAGLENRERQEPPREYIGASVLGGPCKRALQYGYYNTPPDDGPRFDGRVLRIFDVGHAIEELSEQWLKAAGFHIRTRDRNGYQFAFKALDGMLRGHMDGVIVNGPDVIAYPCLWECKSANSKRWKNFVKEKLIKAAPEYYAQIQLYMTYFQLADNPALFMVTNKDTCEIYFELVPYDADCAQRTSDKAVDIARALRSGEKLGRVAKSNDHFECKWCSWKDRCWRQGGNL